MNEISVPMAAVCGALAAAGALAVVASRRQPVPRLGDALELLNGTRSGPEHSFVVEDGTRLGGWVLRTLRIPFSAETETQLRLRGMTVASFFTEKAILGLVGLCLPAVVTGTFSLLLGTSWAVPLVGGLAGMAVGFFVPDLTIRRTASHVRLDSSEALFLFFDLLTLERLANKSGTQALAAAAEISDHPLFAEVRAVLDRARLEQRAPYSALRELGVHLRLPALSDVAEVMQLDEQGASLTGALRARVKELRDAHLNEAVVAAQEISERMTLFMVLPALVFALVFLAPPLLRLIA